MRNTVNETWPSYLKLFMQTPTAQTIDAVAARYPTDPANPGQKFIDFGTDVGFACNSRTLSKTFGDKAYRYVMSVPPATHGMDQAYYFYVDNVTTPGVVDVGMARQFQRYLRRFIVDGDPNGAVGTSGPIWNSHGDWPVYGGDAKIFNITAEGFQDATDYLSVGGRCAFIQDLIDDPANGW